jgi:hypothetical protein
MRNHSVILAGRIELQLQHRYLPTLQRMDAQARVRPPPAAPPSSAHVANFGYPFGFATTTAVAEMRSY